MITADQFAAVGLRVGRVMRTADFPKARKPAYQLWIADFRSEVLVLGAVGLNGDVILLQPDQDAQVGARIG